MGVALALLLLAGAGITLAAGALPGDGGKQGSRSTAPPPPPPALLAPAAAITRDETVDLDALRPAGLRRDQRYLVRVYVNNIATREVELPDGDQFKLRKVALDEGSNAIRVSLVGDGGEGERSAAVTIVRDDIAPEISISQPDVEATQFVDTLTLIGRTEAGADIRITDATSGHDIEVSIDAAGRFSAPLKLTMGNNRLVLRSTDAAGNRGTRRLTIVRGASAAHVELSVAPQEISVDELPARLSVTAQVVDELGRLADAEVVFSLSPPDRETTTYTTTARDGRARWSNLQIERGDRPGQWLVTVLAVLPSGVELRGDASFSLR